MNGDEKHMPSGGATLLKSVEETGGGQGTEKPADKESPDRFIKMCPLVDVWS